MARVQDAGRRRPHRQWQRVSAVALLSACLAAPVHAWERLRDTAPERYTVQAGDTLWDIAGRFLHAPWHWPEVWRENPQINNPHLIYPGDTLTLRDCQGAPCIVLERGKRVVKLSPEVRTLPHREAIEPLPQEVVEAFLRQHRIVDSAEALDELAYVVAGDETRLVSGAGDMIYARLTEPRGETGRPVRGEIVRGEPLGIYRPGERYMGANGESLGLELINVGEAVLVRREGDIAQLDVRRAALEVRSDDILLPLDTPFPDDFMPRAPRNDVSGAILAVPGGVRFIGRLQVVAIDLGTQDGLQPGHVLRVDQQGERVNDPRSQEVLQLPAEEAGTLMVFKPYDHVSYALVMEASRVLEVGDRVLSPQ
ncbi:LysM peptidoglycan-binding domain-containing protein [Vreelandella massiliensis]|uniref:LysM peptidoglycan-binding domain-containing protein n=1 Tax=Vreelandella massiliensis TaxID=1816686 RepID=UPI00096A8708|nr:LysM domain-containing protein [Halomonas massiliensis]